MEPRRIEMLKTQMGSMASTLNQILAYMHRVQVIKLSPLTVLKTMHEHEKDNIIEPARLKDRPG